MPGQQAKATFRCPFCTWQSLSLEKIKQHLAAWCKQAPDIPESLIEQIQTPEDVDELVNQLDQDPDPEPGPEDDVTEDQDDDEHDREVLEEDEPEPVDPGEDLPVDEQRYVLDWGRFGPPQGGTYHLDEDCHTLQRKDSDREPVPLPWPVHELETDDDWSACGFCSTPDPEPEDEDEERPSVHASNGSAQEDLVDVEQLDLDTLLEHLLTRLDHTQDLEYALRILAKAHLENRFAEDAVKDIVFSLDVPVPTEPSSNGATDALDQDDLQLLDRLVWHQIDPFDQFDPDKRTLARLWAKLDQEVLP